MRLCLAHKTGKLLEYLDGDTFSSAIETIDNRAYFLFILFQRPLFDETLRLAQMLGG